MTDNTTRLAKLSVGSDRPAWLAYLAQPIDQVYDVTMHAAKTNQIASLLSAAGYAIYRPAKAWEVTKPPRLDPRLEDVNGLALQLADVLVAYLPAGVPSIGVPMEIDRAIQSDIPVVVVTEVQSFSLQRQGVIVVDSIDDLIDAIRAHEHNHPHFDGQTRLRSIEVERDGLALSGDPCEPEPIRLVVRPGLPIPARAYGDDAGLDLTTVGEYHINPGKFVDVHTQVDAVQLPAGYWGLITGRSSTLRKHGLHIPVAVIDPGWRGPLLVGIWNLSESTVTVKPGDRLAQLILVPNTPAPSLIVEKVAAAERGLAGFGSSGL